MAFVYCPMCGRRKLARNTEDYMACPDRKCGFVHWDNPIPVVAGIVLMNPGIVIVQRKLEPHRGEWCLPCGYVEKWGNPRDEIIREIKEEAGIDARVLLDLGTINPNPGKENRVITFFLCEYVSGILEPGSDAKGVMRCMTENTVPTLCFSSHNEMVQKWIHAIDWAEASIVCREEGA